MKRRPEAERIKEDFHHADGKLGTRSTERLIDLLLTLASDVDAIRSDIEFLKRNRNGGRT